MARFELNGREGVMIYRVFLHGGPNDGEVSHCFRPYDAMLMPGENVYRADVEGEHCLEWVDDWTREIHLNHRPGEDEMSFCWGNEDAD